MRGEDIPNPTKEKPRIEFKQKNYPAFNSGTSDEPIDRNLPEYAGDGTYSTEEISDTEIFHDTIPMTDYLSEPDPNKEIVSEEKRTPRTMRRVKKISVRENVKTLPQSKQERRSRGELRELAHTYDGTVPQTATEIHEQFHAQETKTLTERYHDIIRYLKSLGKKK